MSAHFRQKLTDEIKTELEKDSQIFGAWLGGSKATGREDEVSDTDLVIMAENAEHAFSVFENFLFKKFKVTHIWDLGFSAAFKHTQKFYVIEPSHELYYLDVVVFTEKEALFYSEYYNEARHGIPAVLFDKEKILEAAKKNFKPIEPKPYNFKNTLAQFEVMHRTFLKEAHRQKYIDSFAFYTRLITIVMQALRSAHTPQRHDFGLRYLYSDFPQYDSSLIESSMKVNSISDMVSHALKLKARLHDLAKESSL